MTSGRSLVTLGQPLGATLLLGGIVLAVLVAAGASWADLSAVTGERDAKADLLERSIAASQRPRVASTAPHADPFVVADTATLAAAGVDADLRALASSSGLTLLSSRAEAKVEEPPANAGSGIGTRIEDQAVVEGRNEALQAFLLALDNGNPTVIVDALAIEPAEAPEGTPVDPQVPRLRVTLTLSAYWRPVPRATAR